eukprot:TRINITY_DN11409_c0_g2_i1.p3 TRINITY_DN11409_c0_g2~~TRINITY_DN11409_c0_g2_i1.p3  ORF type:complete len:155 (-),score=4.95 TRINITY_DN11409_c0_g2_i1:2972-3436(-)
MPGDRASMQSPVGDQSWPSGHSSCSLYFGTFATLFTIWIVYVRRMVRALAYTCGVRMIVDRHRNSMVACMHAGDTLQDGSWSVEVTNGRDAHRGLLRLVLLAFDARGMDCYEVRQSELRTDADIWRAHNMSAISRIRFEASSLICFYAFVFLSS